MGQWAPWDHGPHGNAGPWALWDLGPHGTLGPMGPHVDRLYELWFYFKSQLRECWQRLFDELGDIWQSLEKRTAHLRTIGSAAEHKGRPPTGDLQGPTEWVHVGPHGLTIGPQGPHRAPQGSPRALGGDR